MRIPPRAVPTPILPMLALAMLVGGCATCNMPRIDPSGERIFVPSDAQATPVAGQPVAATTPSPCGAPDAAVATGVPVAAAGVGASTDPATGGVPVDREKPKFDLVVNPGKTIAPVGSEVILLGGVRDRANYLWMNERVEWILTPDSVGYFVDLKEASWCDYLVFDYTNPRKVNNRFAVASTTRGEATVLTRGTPSKKDDVKVLKGQAWISITSPTEGVSRVALYSDKVKQWDGHSKTAVIHWIDAEYGFPAPKIGPAGTRQLLTTTVRRHTDMVPCVGWSVRYRVTGGPSAGFAPNGAGEIEVHVNESGQATVELFQPTPTAGVNTIAIEVFRPPMNGAEKLRIGAGTTSVEWTAPKMSVQKSGTSQAGLSDDIRYKIIVTNPGPLTPSNVTLTDEIPVGCEFITATPPAQRAGNELSWQVGPVAPNQSLAFDVTLRPKRPGTFTSCARVAADGGVVSQSCISTEVGAPAITVSVAGPTSAHVGQTVQYKITVTNRGKAAASGLLIKDRFDDGLQHAIARSPIERDLGSLEPGKTRTVDVEFTVIKPGLLKQQVEITGPNGIYQSQETTLTAVEAPAAAPGAGPGMPGGLTPPGTGPGLTPPPVTQPPMTQPPATQPPVTPPVNPPGGTATRSPIRITQSLPASATVGDTVHVTVQVRNAGSEAVRNARLTIRLNDQLEPEFATRGVIYPEDPNEFVWELLRIEPGETLDDFEVVCKCIQPGSAIPVVTSVRLPSGEVRETGTITIRPKRSGTTPPPSGMSGGAGPGGGSPILEAPQLKISVADLRDSIGVGKEETYDIQVENTGRTTARNVQVTAALPPVMQPVSMGTHPEGFKIKGQHIIFAPIPSLPPGQPSRFWVRARATAAGTAVMEVTVAAEGLRIPVKEQEETKVLAEEPSR